MQLVKNGAIVQDDWRHIADDESIVGDKFTVSLQRWKSDGISALAGVNALGVRLPGDADLGAIKDDLGRFALIVIEFPALADGRGFSLARLLRSRYGYRGEIRARGDFIRDQVFFLQRVGVNSFECPDGKTAADLLPALAEFSITYQTSSDQAEPLYRRVRREA